MALSKEIWHSLGGDKSGAAVRNRRRKTLSRRGQIPGNLQNVSWYLTS